MKTIDWHWVHDALSGDRLLGRLWVDGALSGDRLLGRLWVDGDDDELMLNVLRCHLTY